MHKGVLNQATLGKLEIQQNGKTVTVMCWKLNVLDHFSIDVQTNLNVFVNTFVEKTGAVLTAMEKIKIRNWIQNFTKHSITTKEFPPTKMSEKAQLLEKFSDLYMSPED
jgi:hypothetical protein